jgi:F-box/leucine-rich repeat protein 10/11
MKRLTSFKAQYRQAPPRAATPPRPVWEPLSPVLPPAGPSTAPPAGALHNDTAPGSRHANGGATNAPGPWDLTHAPLSLTSPAVLYEPLPRSAPLPQPLPSYSLPLGSPIEALADAAVSSQRTSPAYVEPPRRAAHAANSPPARLHPTNERAPRQAFARDPTHPYSERPAKRARSEHHASPTYGTYHSRPATSHIPGYNVEMMMDSGMRMYQDSRAVVPPPPPQQQQQHQSNGGDKMLSDAELLLFFSNVSAHTAQTPPSTAKRWSVSQASPSPALPPQQTQPKVEHASPHAVTTPNAVNHHQSKEAPLDSRPLADSSSFPVNVVNAAPASQTQTPPEETVTEVAQTVTQEPGPVEDSKPKKQQSGPKGKPRGSRNTPSTGKRKRSTPKPKHASSTSTSAGPDQLQSPQSLPAEQSGVVTSNDTSRTSHGVEQPTPPTLHSRRHSFSTSSPQLSRDEASFTYIRARSVPLGGEQLASAPIEHLDRPTNKAVVEQPELICAACKSSDSEVKVGDGEQWIGCDGCKEWYHYACAGFNSEREVRDVNKFYCDPCRPKFGETTSRSTDAIRRYNSNLAQRFASPLESIPRSTMPVSMKASSKHPTTTPNITTSLLSRTEI